MNDLMSKITAIFDDGTHDEKAKPQVKRSAAFVIAVGFLTLVTGAFTYSYLARAVERMSIVEALGPLKYVIPLAGVIAFDLGAILWSMVWRSNASNDGQSKIARVMFIVDVIGMMLTTLAHFLDHNAMPQILAELTPFAVATILVANVVAYFEYEDQSDAVRLAREYRARYAALERQRLQAEIELRRAESSLGSRIEAAEQTLRLAQMEDQLADLELKIRTMRGGRELLATDVATVQEAKQTAREALAARFNRWRDEQFASARARGNGHEAHPNP